MCRPWDKSQYTEYYDLMKQASKLTKKQTKETKK